MHSLAHAAGDLRVVFCGRGQPPAAADRLAVLPAAPPHEVHLHQVHSATVVDAADGPPRAADALFDHGSGRALCIVTADCVPLLLADEQHQAAVHAGWRGLAAGIVEAALARFPRPAAVRAWIGPAIGGCCYEIGADVAEQLAGPGAAAAVVRHRDRWLADLPALVEARLQSGGVPLVERSGPCTRCDPGRNWWSYRRDGAGAGRNHAFIWRVAAPAASDRSRSNAER